MNSKWRIGDRFRVKPNGGWDEHLWEKEGVVLGVKAVMSSRGCPMVEFVMDRPSQHPDRKELVVFRGMEYLDHFNEAVEKVD
jgi:hypothetical protein